MDYNGNIVPKTEITIHIGSGHKEKLKIEIKAPEATLLVYMYMVYDVCLTK